MIKKVLAIVCGIMLAYWLIDDFDLESVKGKRVLITGASTGIGEQLAYQYARLGANVLITARRENKLKEVLARCRELGSTEQTYDYVTADMMNVDSLETVMEEAVDKLGGLDVLVLNHIMLFPGGVWKGSKQNISSIRKVMTVNFESYVHMASYGLPYLDKSNGNIIVVSSVVGKIAGPYFAPYATSKFALDGFFSTLRQELKMRNSGISITLCVLGFINTDNAMQLLSDLGLKFLLSVMKAESPSDTALAIVKNGALRMRQMYYPQSAYFSILFRDWAPETLEYILRYISYID